MANPKKDRSSWVIGGMTMIGLGVGLIFVTVSPIIMVASLIIGIGLGLVVAPFVKESQTG